MVHVKEEISIIFDVRC